MRRYSACVTCVWGMPWRMWGLEGGIQGLVSAGYNVLEGALEQAT